MSRLLVAVALRLAATLRPIPVQHRAPPRRLALRRASPDDSGAPPRRLAYDANDDTTFQRLAKSKDDEDETWRRIAKSKDDAVDVFLGWAREDAAFGACLRVVALRRGRFGGDVTPERWPSRLRQRLAPGLSRRDAARSARRAVWAEKSYKAESLRLSWTELQAAYAERERVVAHVNGAAEELGGKWVYKLGLLQAYAQEHDDARVPSAHVTACGVRLGRWLGDQRRFARTGRLEPRRRAQLLALDGGILLSDSERAWRAQYGRLADFVRREGHADVPRNATERGACLGLWLLDQRNRADAGLLDPVHAEKLDGLGVSWSTPREARWDAAYEALGRYAAARGDCRVPANFTTFDGRKLGQWVVKQRRLKRAGSLAADRAALLDALGFAWAPNDRGDAYAAALAAFVAREGHARVPRKHREADLGLGEWLAKQRRKPVEERPPALRRVLEGVG